MGQGHEHWQIFGEEEIITCNVQRGDPSTLTNLVQSLSELYNLLSKRKKNPNATILVRQFFFVTNPWRGQGVQKNFPGAKFFSNPPPWARPSSFLVAFHNYCLCLCSMKCSNRSTRPL